MDEGCADDDVTCEALAWVFCLLLVYEGDPLGEGLVHLPVPSYDILSHCLVIEIY